MSHDLETSSKRDAALAVYATYNRLGGYDPYEFQRAYHRCQAGRWIKGEWEPTDGEANQVLLLAGNRSGKSVNGYADDAIHATGRYPTWWDGPRLGALLRRFPRIWVGGPDNDTVRDIGQAELCGDPNDPDAWGKGWLPRDCLPERDDNRRVVRKQGIPNALDSVQVLHDADEHGAAFWVTVSFKSFDSDLLKWAGRPVALIHNDEESPQVIYNQCLARTLDTGGYVKQTFTPEKGMSPVIQQFREALQPGQLYMQVSWNDAKRADGASHLSESRKAQLLAAFPPHERKMRSEGEPVFGSGLVFYVAQERYVIPRQEEFPIPDHWPRIVGMDFGRGGENHPTAAAWWAFDKDAKRAYLYDCYKSKALEPAVHAAAIKARGEWIPVAWPHDGHRKEAYATGGVMLSYKAMGLRMLPSHFDNQLWSPDPKDKGNAVEPGIFRMNQKMDEGFIVVFARCADFLTEALGYHRSEKDGSIIPVNDDVISAARIGYLSERKAIPKNREETLRAAQGGLCAGVNDYNPIQERA